MYTVNAYQIVLLQKLLLKNRAHYLFSTPFSYLLQTLNTNSFILFTTGLLFESNCITDRYEVKFESS